MMLAMVGYTFTGLYLLFGVQVAHTVYACAH